MTDSTHPVLQIMDAYHVLELPCKPATKAEVKKAYHKIALANHPDKIGPAGEERMKFINAAYDKIMTNMWFKAEIAALSSFITQHRRYAMSKAPRQALLHELVSRITSLPPYRTEEEAVCLAELRIRLVEAEMESAGGTLDQLRERLFDLM